MDSVKFVEIFLKSNAFLGLKGSGLFSKHDLSFVPNGAGGYKFNNLIVDSVFNGYLQGFADGVTYEIESK